MRQTLAMIIMVLTFVFDWHLYLAWILAAAVTLGLVLGLVKVFWWSLPSGMEERIRKINTLLGQAKASDLASRLLHIEELAYLLVDAVSVSKSSLGLLSLGAAHSSLFQVRLAQRDFEALAMNFIKGASQKIREAESPQFSDLWNGKIEFSRYLLGISADAVNDFCRWLDYYHSIMSLLVALIVMLTALTALILQAFFSGRKLC